jgi:hypothetical protein
MSKHHPMEKILLSMSQDERDDISEMMEVTGNDLEDLYAALPNTKTTELLSRGYYNKNRANIKAAHGIKE